MEVESVPERAVFGEGMGGLKRDDFVSDIASDAVPVAVLKTKEMTLSKKKKKHLEKSK